MQTNKEDGRGFTEKECFARLKAEYFYAGRKTVSNRA